MLHAMRLTRIISHHRHHTPQPQINLSFMRLTQRQAQRSLFLEHKRGRRII